MTCDQGFHQLAASLIREEVMEVFRAVLDNPSHHFFGVTGDIDDLGVFVAQHGRAHAENLVDYVGTITEHHFSNWRRKNSQDVSSYAFLPGGEEMLLLGTCASDIPLRELFTGSRESIDQVLMSSGFFPADNLSVSFGCAIFQREEFLSRFTRLLDDYDDIVTKYRAYLELMYYLRRTLSVCLDLEKFQLFGSSHPEIAIACRNLVHFDLLRHKDRSRTLISLATSSLLEPRYFKLLRIVSDDYGMLNSRMEATSTLVEALESEHG